MIYIVSVFDARSTQENPIKPRVVAVTIDNLSSFLAKNVSSDTYCMVSTVESDSDGDDCVNTSII